MTRPTLLVLACISTSCVPRVDPGPIPVVEQARPARMVVLPDASSPNLYLQAVVSAGSSWDLPGQEGLAHLTARALVDAGAGELSSTELREALYPTGNAVQLVVDKEWVSVRLRCHRDHAELCVDRFADVLTAPRFADNDVIRLREEAVFQLTDGLTGDDEALGEAALHAVLYEGHPYAHPVAGRAGVVPTLDADDLRRFYESHYVRSSVVVGMAGAVDDTLQARLEARLQALPSAPVPNRVDMAPPPVEGGSLTLVRTPRAVTGWHVAHPLPTDRLHPDWPALYVAMIGFGAHRQSFGQLFQAVRGRRGLNYGAYAYVEAYVQQGWSPAPENGVLRRHNHFVMWLRPTSVDNGPFALKLAEHELERLREEGLPDDVFEEVVSYLRGSLPLLATDPGRRLAFALDAEISGTPEMIEQLSSALDTLDNEAVTAALQRHIRPDDLVYVGVSGDPEATRDALLSSEPTPVAYAEVTPDEAQAAEDATVARRGMSIDPSRVVITSPEGVFR
jgi:zinc protease